MGSNNRKGWFGLRVLAIHPELARRPYESEANAARGLIVTAPGDERLAWLDGIKIEVGEFGKYSRVEADTVKISVETGGEDGKVYELVVHKDGSVRLYSGG